MPNLEQYQKLKKQLDAQGVALVAISKTKPKEDILSFYEQGQRIFGENRAQEMAEKSADLPKDIEWHFVGHLQRNKVKYIIESVALLHSGDSPRLIKEVNKEARKIDRTVELLLQFKIAKEDSKYGLGLEQARSFLSSEAFQKMENIRLRGVMGMATFTDDTEQVRAEFKKLKNLFEEIKTTFFAAQEDFNIVSMGMSGDYPIAIEEGSTMVRIGSLLFGARD